MYTYLVDTAHKREKKRHVLSQLDTDIHLGPPSPGARQVLPRLIHRQRSGLDSALCIID